MQKKNNNKSGFTIIEVMVAVSIFVIVVTVGMGALLNANSVHNKSQNMRSIMDNMNFIMEDISRNLRTGYNYRCINSLPDSAISTPLSGNSCFGIAFELATNNPPIPTPNDQWVYTTIYNGVSGIFKSTDGGDNFIKLTPTEVNINTTLSKFSVLGAEPPPSAGGSNLQQPFATIILVGDITYKSFVTPFSLQTSVSQRAFDI